MKGGFISVMREFLEVYGFAMRNDVLDIQIGLSADDSRYRKAEAGKSLLSLGFSCGASHERPCECESGYPDIQHEFMNTGLSVPADVENLDELKKWYMEQSTATHLYTSFAFEDGDMPELLEGEMEKEIYGNV